MMFYYRSDLLWNARVINKGFMYFLDAVLKKDKVLFDVDNYRGTIQSITEYYISGRYVFQQENYRSRYKELFKDYVNLDSFGSMLAEAYKNTIPIAKYLEEVLPYRDSIDKYLGCQSIRTILRNYMNSLREFSEGDFKSEIERIFKQGGFNEN